MNSLFPHPDEPCRHGNVVQWLAVGAAAHADVPALVFGDRSLTYAELDRFSNRIARHLAEGGVEPGDCVGICLDRSMEMVASLIGILKAGAAYVPLDPAYPADRLAMMQEDARLRCVLAHRVHAGIFAANAGRLLVWEEIEETLADGGFDAVVIDPENVAYVIFTSGSTGRPKGIAMPHRALSNLIEWQLERKTFKPGARVLQYSSISFDVSFQEIATTLASGGTLFLVSNDDRKDPRKLLEHLLDQRIERLFLPYVAMRSMIEAAHVVGTYPAALKEIITAGEQLRVDDTVRAFFAKIEHATLDNQYGPSETHVITAHLLEGDPGGWPDLPPIGLPLKNCGTCILDESMQPVGDGETGELYLAGRNLAHGYIHRADLTEKVFIPSPFGLPGRPVLYKTGDLASYNPDGTIDFLGRRDHQLKIRGHRIEPGEINNAASSFPGVAQCLTHAASGTGNVLQLAIYYTLKPGAKVSVSVAELREHLARKLPEYMLPAFLIELEGIPYTPSGKVDLKSLPQPSIENSQYAHEEVSYESETEAGVAEIWVELLGLEGIPRTADFFELGGDSLRAVTLFLRIQQRFGQELSLATLTHASTIARLAAIIDGKGDAPDLSAYRSLKMIQQGEAGVAPLFLVHGGQGNVLVFNGFVRMLDPRRPVYAFQWSGWDGHRGESDIREMARLYKDELVRFLPEGSVRLGGYCIGGLIAIELVRLLAEAGRSVVHPLVVWDSPNLESKHYRKDEPWDSAATIDAFNRMKGALEEIRLDTTVDPENVPKSDYSPATGKAALVRKVPGLISLLRFGKEAKQYCATVPTRLKIAATLARRQPLPMELRSLYCLWTMVKAVKKHRSSRYGGEVLYFRSDCVVGRYFGLAGWWDDPFLGFAELCEGRFEAHAIGGGHTDVLDIPEMGEIVRRAFESTEPV